MVNTHALLQPRARLGSTAISYLLFSLLNAIIVVTSHLECTETSYCRSVFSLVEKVVGVMLTSVSICNSSYC